MTVSNNFHRPRSYILHIFFVIILFILNSFGDSAVDKEDPITVPIGVVLDLNSSMGSMVHSCMEVAVSDFYSQNPNHITRLKLQTKNARTLLDAHLAVMELLKQEQVHGVIGPQESLLAEIGKEHHVPVISLSVRNSPVSYTNHPYLVRTTPDNTVQARALASICQGFEWHEVAVFYEDTDDGNQFLSHINKALQEIEIRLAYMVSISNSYEDSHISRELNRLPTRQTRVFIVHMGPSLGSRFFRLAKSLGVVSEGYAWIISDSMSNFMYEMDSITREAMDGVLGIRPYVSTSSQDFKSFQERLRKNMVLKTSSSTVMELNVYGLWAYDAVTALAIAVEKTARAQQRSTSISNFRQTLLDEVSRTRFQGLSGEFQIINGSLKLSAFEVFNVYGSGEKPIGFWTPERGRRRELRSEVVDTDFRKVIWPGDSITKPESPAIPMNGVLRVGVTSCNSFKEFVSCDTVDPVTKTKILSGFSIDIFDAALSVMPFPIKPEYIYCANDSWSYDDVLRQIPEGKVDMVVGDTTIWAARTAYVDFTQPYLESGVVLVVKNNRPMNMWIFTRPLRWDLWLAIFVSFSLMGTVLLVLEHRLTRSSEDFASKGRRRMTYFAPVAILAFPESNMVTNKWSLFVLVFWLFMAFILMQSYTANLAAILTVDQLNFAFSDDYNIGYLEGSFMEKFLTDNLHINKSRLRNFTSIHDYHVAMSKGSKNGGIDAIFDEIPYMKILIKTYSPQYKMVGPTYRCGGFGFAFPRYSPLVSHFSRAILEVVQGSNMTAFERKNFGPGYSSDDPLSNVFTQETSSLRLYDFGGLFLVVGSVTMLALFFSETPLGMKTADKTVNFIKRCFGFDDDDDDVRVHDNADDRSNNNNAAATGVGEIGLTRQEENNGDSAGNNNNDREGLELCVDEEVLEHNGDGEDNNNVHEMKQSNGVIDTAQIDRVN